ncbi:hypothetical protein GUF49_18765, partial [Xanthomonas citri pv. citri]|nr:hypothetical protein [Xanthomonas citri pv. citri]
RMARQCLRERLQGLSQSELMCGVRRHLDQSNSGHINLETFRAFATAEAIVPVFEHASWLSRLAMSEMPRVIVEVVSLDREP